MESFNEESRKMANVAAFLQRLKAVSAEAPKDSSRYDFVAEKMGFSLERALVRKTVLMETPYEDPEEASKRDQLGILIEKKLRELMD